MIDTIADGPELAHTSAMRPLRIGLYALASLAVVVVAYAIALRPVHHTGAQGSPASWSLFLRAYLYESLDRQSQKSPSGASACDYPPLVDGKRADSADHDHKVSQHKHLRTALSMYLPPP